MDAKKGTTSLNMAKTMKVIEQAFRIYISELHIEFPSQVLVILMITYYHQGIIQQDIAEIVKKDKSAVLRQIDMLEEKGLIRRQADENDRRKKFIILTDEGTKVAQTLAKKEAEFFRLLLHGVNQQEVETFEKVLTVLKTNAENI